MSDLTVNIQTPSGFEVQGALIPDNITVQQVIAELLGGLSLPRLANGQPINYSLVLVNRGLVLRGDQTLQDGGVQFGDTIRLVTGAEPSNGNQGSRAAESARNGSSASFGEPAWQSSPSTPAVGQSLPAPPSMPPPVAAPQVPVAAPVAPPAVTDDWMRGSAAATTSDWRSGPAASETQDRTRDARSVPAAEPRLEIPQS